MPCLLRLQSHKILGLQCIFSQEKHRRAQTYSGPGMASILRSFLFSCTSKRSDISNDLFSTGRSTSAVECRLDRIDIDRDEISIDTIFIPLSLAMMLELFLSSQRNGDVMSQTTTVCYRPARRICRLLLSTQYSKCLKPWHRSIPQQLKSYCLVRYLAA